MIGRALLIATATLVTTGCVRSIEDISQRPVTETVVTARALPTVRDCLVLAMNKARAQPIETAGADGGRIITFSSEVGAISQFELSEADGGTRVAARRRTMIADHFDDARACYNGGNPGT